jgi:hypothetical protein
MSLRQDTTYPKCRIDTKQVNALIGDFLTATCRSRHGKTLRELETAL